MSEPNVNWLPTEAVPDNKARAKSVSEVKSTINSIETNTHNTQPSSPIYKNGAGSGKSGKKY